MKRILSLLVLVILYNTLCAQTTVVQTLQMKSGQGAAPIQTMPVNGGLAYVDVNGIIRKSDLKALLGKKVDSASRLNDSTIQFTSQFGNTYNVIIRGLYDVATKGFVDSLHSGQKADTTILRILGNGKPLTNTAQGITGTTPDTLLSTSILDSTDIKFRQNTDGSLSPYLVATGVSANTYGDGTHVVQIQVDARGRITAISSVAISSVGNGVTNVNVVASATADTIKSSTGSPGVIPAAVANISAGIVTAAKQARYDSLVAVANSGHGFPLLRAPTTLDSLVARGIAVTATGRVVSTYTGNKDSVSFNVTLINSAHTIFTPTTGQTITLVAGNKNLVNPAGTIAALTITLPSSPVNNDEVTIKFTQVVTTITWAGGTVVGGSTGATAGTLITLTYDSITTSWY